VAIALLRKSREFDGVGDPFSLALRIGFASLCLQITNAEKEILTDPYK
jgi:hypothetical protein